MSVRYRSQTPTTTMITSKGEQYEIKTPTMASQQSLFRRKSSSVEEDTERILKQIRAQKILGTSMRNVSTSPPLSRKSSITNDSSNNYRSPTSYSTKTCTGPPRPSHRMGSLPPLPPSLPRQVKHHYPLPPPSFPDAMIAVSKRLRNRSISPSPQYAQLQVNLIFDRLYKRMLGVRYISRI